MFQKHKMACAKVKVRGMCSQGVPGDEAKQRSFVLQTFQMPEFNKAAWLGGSCSSRIEFRVHFFPFSNWGEKKKYRKPLSFCWCNALSVMFRAAQVFHLSFVQCRWSVKVFSLTQRVLCLLCTIALCTVQLFNFLTCYISMEHQAIQVEFHWKISVFWYLTKISIKWDFLLLWTQNECFSRHGDETDDFLSALSFLIFFFLMTNDSTLLNHCAC